MKKFGLHYKNLANHLLGLEEISSKLKLFLVSLKNDIDGNK